MPYGIAIRCDRCNYSEPIRYFGIKHRYEGIDPSALAAQLGIIWCSRCRGVRYAERGYFLTSLAELDERIRNLKKQVLRCFFSQKAREELKRLEDERNDVQRFRDCFPERRSGPHCVTCGSENFDWLDFAEWVGRGVSPPVRPHIGCGAGGSLHYESSLHIVLAPAPQELVFLNSEGREVMRRMETHEEAQPREDAFQQSMAEFMARLATAGQKRKRNRS